MNSTGAVRAPEAFVRKAVLDVGELKRRRLANGYTQGQIAGMLGVSKAAYSKWECNHGLPRPKRFKQLAKILRVKPLDLTRIIEQIEA